jgi:rSAM/selenodomain-associated transferase 2
MKISVIIPTLNESENIGHLVVFIREFGAKRIGEVIVVDGQSTDDTVIVAKQAGAHTLISPIKSRASQMNLGAKYATGDILYFIHADIKLIPSFAQDIKESVEAGFCSGCYRYVFDSSKSMLRINAYCTRFNRIMCRGGDQTLFVTRSVFENLGGFNETFSIMEDYDFIIRLQKEYTFRIIPKNVVVSARKYETNSWLRVQLANLTVFIMFFLQQPPDRMKRLYGKMLSYR